VDFVLFLSPSIIYLIFSKDDFDDDYDMENPDIGYLPEEKMDQNPYDIVDRRTGEPLCGLEDPDHPEWAGQWKCAEAKNHKGGHLLSRQRWTRRKDFKSEQTN
jgi:hypothetical protein